MKIRIARISGFLLLSLFSQSCQNSSSNKIKLSQNKTKDNSIYQFTKVETIDEKSFDFSSLKGKKVLIVNTASKCGLTGQYKDLQNLYETYKESGFEIIGFPSNDFNNQEPGNNVEIINFCKTNYGVSFPLMSKIKVLGENSHVVYKYLKKNSPNNHGEIKWNFQKFLIGEEGIVEKVISPQTNPLDSSITNWIEN